MHPYANNQVSSIKTTVETSSDISSDINPSPLEQMTNITGYILNNESSEEAACE